MLLRLVSGKDVAAIVDEMFLTTVALFGAFAFSIPQVLRNGRYTAFSVGFEDRQSLLASLEAAARKIGYRLQSPDGDGLQIQLKPSKCRSGGRRNFPLS
jgi:hypothetical protein